MAKRKNKELNINIIILIICILFLTIAIFIKESTPIRPILWITAIIMLSMNIGIKNKFKITSTIFFIITFFCISIITDGIIVYTFKRLPVFSYNIINTENSRVYHSIGMRVWQCDKNNYDNLIVDPFYKNGYMCNALDITAIESNSFLNSVVENHSEYHNKYIKIRGKISKKSGQNLIEMRPYTETNNSINGYVEFADNITLRIIFNNSEPELDNYDIYDEITVVGLIKNIENNNSKYIIYMYDSKVVSTINLNEYAITITSSKKCQNDPVLISSNDNNDIYTYCIDDAIVSYPDNKYELPQALSSNKITIEDIYSNSNKEEKNPENNSIIYRFDDYSVLVCDNSLSKDIYIANKKLSFLDITCKPKVEE
ncbi:MAG: hypothetical protein ACI4XM_02160 [Candidatus Coprovivens sp.]